MHCERSSYSLVISNMKKQIVVIGGIVSILVIGTVSFMTSRSSDSRQSFPERGQQQNVRPTQSPQLSEERPQIPAATESAGSALAVGDQVIIETRDASSEATKVTILGGQMMPPQGGFPGGDRPEPPAGFEGMERGEGGPGGEFRGVAPSGFVGRVTAVSETSVTISGRDGESTFSMTTNTVFESQ
jgi:hypothetical protein